ncbi:MAG: Cof-type HAD-IIB family hydrolase [Oscillospiraceae bacterium]|jgi:Cof subfamily protein (haloacid dehalogenase superfamily)|nr:Cof-type HAD-IIB family hydrolase [Oscillospiraceae bacterium]
MNFNNIFFIADADGTLLTDDKRILETDRAAIRELTEHGGLFAIATGRGVALARTVWSELFDSGEQGADTPAVIFNGAAVYDFKRECFLWQSTLPEIAKDYIKRASERFPALGVEILRGDEIYVTSTNRREEEHLALGLTEPIRCGFDDVPPDNWIKTLLVGEPEEIDEAIEFTKTQGFDEVHLVRSAPVFYEMLPKGVNKGTGFKKLLEIMNLSDKFIIAAGDFMNDLEMLQMADLGIAVANAEDCVKDTADLIVCNNNSGAMHEIIEYLKRVN